MLENLFIVFLVIATCAFFAAFTTAKKNLRMFLLATALIVTVALGFAALNIEHIYCDDAATGCSLYSVQDWAIAWLCWGYGAVALLGVFVTSIQQYDPQDGTLL